MIDYVPRSIKIIRYLLQLQYFRNWKVDDLLNIAIILLLFRLIINEFYGAFYNLLLYHKVLLKSRML